MSLSPRRRSPSKKSPKRKSPSPKRKSPSPKRKNESERYNDWQEELFKVHELKSKGIRFLDDIHQIRHSVKENREFHLSSITTSLNLAGLELSQIPSWFFKNSTHLEKLYLNANQLTSLPLEIGNLTQLVELNLAYNRLVSLPSEIGNLTQLKRLDLDHNNFTFVPEEIGNFKQLEILDLSSNQIKLIPEEIGELIKLQVLILYDTPLERISYKINLPNLNWSLSTEEVKRLQRQDKIEEKISKLNPLVKSGTLHYFNQKDIEKLLLRQKYE